jgi:hypothetical protein
VAKISRMRLDMSIKTLNVHTGSGGDGHTSTGARWDYAGCQTCTISLEGLRRQAVS